MRKFVTAALAATGLLASAGVSAQSFTYEVDIAPPTFVGGLGPDGSYGRGGTTGGPYTTTLANGDTATGTLTCVGMDQPPSTSLFAVHLACDAVATDGSTRTSVLYGCNPIGEDDGPLSCVGGIEGKTGPNAGRRGSVTLHLRGENSVGTGQWYE